MIYHNIAEVITKEDIKISLLKKFFNRYKKKKEILSLWQKEELITFIGLSFAGKSTILHRLRANNFLNDSFRTLGINIDTFTYHGIKFQAFDLGGQPPFQVIWKKYLQLSSTVVFVVDCSEPEEFKESKDVFYNALPYISPNSVLLIVANKADLSGPDPYILLLKEFNLYNIQQIGRFRAINMFHMSAKTGSNFYQAFDWLIETLTREIILPNITIYHAYIYQTESGILVGCTAPNQEQTQSNPNYDPVLLTSMFSVVNTFAQASMGAEVMEVLMKRSKNAANEISGNYKMVRIEESDFSVILIVNESDSIRMSFRIGKDLLLWTRLKVPNKTLIQRIDEIEIQTYLKLKFPNEILKASFL